MRPLFVAVQDIIGPVSHECVSLNCRTDMNDDIKAQYERLLEAGKTKMCALGAAMRKLVRICYGVLKHQRPYENRARQS